MLVNCKSQIMKKKIINIIGVLYLWYPKNDPKYMYNVGLFIIYSVPREVKQIGCDFSNGLIRTVMSPTLTRTKPINIFECYLHVHVGLNRPVATHTCIYTVNSKHLHLGTRGIVNCCVCTGICVYCFQYTQLPWHAVHCTACTIV